jgi:hypothetical protein
MLGRLASKRRRREIELYWHRWRKSRDIQRCYRGHVARVRVHKIRAENYRIKIINAATNIQRVWRGRRGRVITALLRGLHELRIKRIKYASIIQRNYRGYRGRMRAIKVREEYAFNRKRLISTCLIQRTYRGHKGKEMAEIERKLLEMESVAKPLFSLLATLEDEAAKLTVKLNRLENEVQFLETEVDDIKREKLFVDHTDNKWSDSTRVNGILQRFLTKFLRIRLVDILNNTEVIYIQIFYIS